MSSLYRIFFSFFLLWPETSRTQWGVRPQSLYGPSSFARLSSFSFFWAELLVRLLKKQVKTSVLPSVTPLDKPPSQLGPLLLPLWSKSMPYISGPHHEWWSPRRPQDSPTSALGNKNFASRLLWARLVPHSGPSVDRNLVDIFISLYMVSQIQNPGLMFSLVMAVRVTTISPMFCPPIPSLSM